MWPVFGEMGINVASVNVENRFERAILPYSLGSLDLPTAKISEPTLTSPKHAVRKLSNFPPCHHNCTKTPPF